MQHDLFSWDQCVVLRAPCALPTWAVALDEFTAESTICVVAYIETQWVCAPLHNPSVPPSEYWRQVWQYPMDQRWRPGAGEVIGYIGVSPAGQRTAIVWRLLVDVNGRVVPGPKVGRHDAVMPAVHAPMFRSTANPPIETQETVSPTNPVLGLLQQLVEGFGRLETRLTPGVPWYRRMWGLN